MKTKVLLVSALLLLAGCFVIESDAFTAGGGANLPGKREREVSRPLKIPLLLKSVHITRDRYLSCFVFLSLGCLSLIGLVMLVLSNFLDLHIILFMALSWPKRC